MGLEKPSGIFFHGGYQSSSGDNHNGGSSGSASNRRRQRQLSIHVVLKHASAKIQQIHI